MTKRKGTKQAALVDCIKHLQEEDKIATLWHFSYHPSADQDRSHFSNVERNGRTLTLDPS